MSETEKIEQHMEKVLKHRESKQEEALLNFANSRPETKSARQKYMPLIAKLDGLMVSHDLGEYSLLHRVINSLKAGNPDEARDDYMKNRSDLAHLSDVTEAVEKGLEE
ncbi:MAG: hypothetical protein HY225_02645 [Candidatus Vogelbacteria bacterium]|nr:hypothetical protein [Candidatus Vogelbacteria bacterium]